MTDSPRSPLPPFDTAALHALEREAETLTTPLCEGDGRLVWRRWGQGPAIVALHGGAGSWRHWARCIPTLAATHAVYVPDMPGLGDSDNLPEPTTLDIVGRSLAEGIASLLPAGARFDLMGFSFGSSVSGQVALQSGDALRTLTLVGPGGLGLSRTVAKLHNWRGAADEQAELEIHRLNLASLMIADATKIDDVALEIQQRNARLARLKGRNITPLDALVPVFARLDPAIVHAIVGERDVVAAAHMDERRRFFAERLPPGHFHIVPGAGHWLMHEAPEALLALLAPILAREPHRSA